MTMKAVSLTPLCRISQFDLPALNEGGVGGVWKPRSDAAQVGGGEVEGKVCVSFQIGVRRGHRVVRDVLSQFCIL